MRWFVRQSNKGGCVCSSKQYYKSKISDDVLKVISEELNVKGKIFDIIETYLNYRNKHFRIFEKEYENHFNDYRDEVIEEKYLCQRKIKSTSYSSIIKTNKIRWTIMGFRCYFVISVCYMGWNKYLS